MPSKSSTGSATPSRKPKHSNKNKNKKQLIKARELLGEHDKKSTTKNRFFVFRLCIYSIIRIQAPPFAKSILPCSHLLRTTILSQPRIKTKLLSQNNVPTYLHQPITQTVI